jgi:hypothetical protein
MLHYRHERLFSSLEDEIGSVVTFFSYLGSWSLSCVETRSTLVRSGVGNGCDVKSSVIVFLLICNLDLNGAQKLRRTRVARAFQ